MSNEALKVVTGETVDDEATRKAEELDYEIRKVQVMAWADLYPLLIEMRDTKAYKKLRKLGLNEDSTFADYCATVQQLSKSRANDIIQEGLVYQAIADYLDPKLTGNSGQLPESSYHCRMLIDRKVAQFETRQGPNDTKPIPIAIANPEDVAEEWAHVCAAYEQRKKDFAVKQDEIIDEHIAEGKKPPKRKACPRMSGNFVAENISDEARENYLRKAGQGEAVVTDNRRIATFMRTLEKMQDRNNWINELTKEKLDELVEKEDWTEMLRDSICMEIDSVIKGLRKAKRVLEELEVYVDE